MIQRKQTIYLLLAFICMSLLLYFPIFTITAEHANVSYAAEFSAYGMSGEEGQSASFPLYILFIILALLSAWAIMSFRNRKRQLLLTRINLILTILLGIGLGFFYYVGQGRAMENLVNKGYENPVFDMGIGFYLAVAAIPFLILAIRGIKQDEKLVSAIDRIR